MPGALASLDRLGDESLVTMALRGKRDAFDLLCLRNLDRIYGTLHAALGSAEEAERSASDVLLAIAAGLPDFQGDTSYHVWQYSILRQYIKDRLRSKYRHPELISELWFEGLPGDPELPLLDRTRAWSEGMLGQLAPAHRTILEERLVRRTALDHAAVGLDIDDSRAIALQYFALRSIALKGIPGTTGSEAELYLEQEEGFLDEQLRKRMEAVNRYVEGLIAEESHSDVGRMISKEDVPALRAAHALWYAGSNDYEQRLEPEIVHGLQQLGWDALVQRTGKDTGRSRIGRNPVVIGGVALLFMISLASGYFVNGPAPEEPDIPFEGKTVEVKPGAFGRLTAAVSDGADPTLQPEGVAFVWVGGDFSGMPEKSPVLRLATRPASAEEAATFASRFGLDDPPLEPSEDSGAQEDSWIYGAGTYENPRPGTYRLQIEKKTGRFSYLHIGVPQDIDASIDENSAAPELTDSEKSSLAEQAKDFLASKGLRAPFHSDPKVLAPENGGPNVQVVFGRKIRQKDVLDETGAGVYADVSVLMSVDGGVVEVTGILPRNWESSEYKLTPPEEALNSLTGGRGGPPEVTVTFDKASLVYRAVEIDGGERYLEPVYLLTGKVAGSDEVFKKIVPAINPARN